MDDDYRNARDYAYLKDMGDTLYEDDGDGIEPREEEDY